MRVLLASYGSRGDVQPIIALALGLRAAGHEPIVSAPPNFDGWVRSYGLTSVPAGVDFQEALRRYGVNVLKALPEMRGEVRAQAAVLEQVVPEVDLVVGASVCAAGGTLAERFGKPFRYVIFSPSVIPSGEHAAPMVPWQRLPRWMNRASWRANGLLWNGMFRGVANRERTPHGLPPVRDVWRGLIGSDLIAATEPSLVPVPADAEVRVVQPGVFFLPESEPLSRSVEGFLEAGPPPVYLGFGSMSEGDPGDTMRRLLAAVRQANVRAIISRGWAGMEADVLPEDVCVIGPEPHGKLFPRCAAIVHHGGAGTTAQAARSGIPQVLMPHLLDQYYWADRVERAGLSARPIAKRRFSPARLATAIRRCLEDEALRVRARTFASGMILDGVERAVSYLEQVDSGTAAAA